MAGSDTRTVTGTIVGVSNSTALTGTPSYAYLLEIDGAVHRLIVEDRDAVDECDLLDLIHERLGTDGHDDGRGRTMVAQAVEDGEGFAAQVSDISWS